MSSCAGVCVPDGASASRNRGGGESGQPEVRAVEDRLAPLPGLDVRPREATEHADEHRAEQRALVREHDDRGHGEHEARADPGAAREIDDLVLRQREQRTQDQDRSRGGQGSTRGEEDRDADRSRGQCHAVHRRSRGDVLLHDRPFKWGGGGKASVPHLSAVGEGSAASEQQRSSRRRKQCNTDIDLLHWENHPLREFLPGAQLEPQRDSASLRGPFGPDYAEALPSPSITRTSVTS